jgi:Integrase core domain
LPEESGDVTPMADLLRLFSGLFVDLFRSRLALEAELLVLRQQIIVLRRGSSTRLRFLATNRWLLGWVCQLFPNVRQALAIVRPGTVLRWHRAGFRSYWRWKSSGWPGRPAVALEIRKLIREMSIANPLWGAPRIHGELIKLGIDIGQTSVAKYMVRTRRPPSQGWKTFLRNHADGIAAMDLFVVPTVSFRLLYGLLIMGHGRRQIMWLGVTTHPTAEWIANQITQACGWDWAPRYLIHDRDACYGAACTRRIRSLGIRDHPTSARSPWQNGHAERLIGSIRRECLDHIVVFGERHLRHVLLCYVAYYNTVRTHLSLDKDAPIRRPPQTAGRIRAQPVLGGLHHQYVRI